MENNIDLLTIAITLISFYLIFCLVEGKNNFMANNGIRRNDKNEILEKMTCIFNKEDEERLNATYLWDQDFEDHFMFKIKDKKMELSSGDLEKLKILLIEKSTFEKQNFTIKSHFKEPKKVVFYIEEMIDFILIDDSKDYREKIDENTKINLIIHLLLILRIRKLFHCRNLQKKIGDDAPKIASFVSKLLSEDIVKICSEKELINYCKDFNPNVKIAELNKDTIAKEIEGFSNGINIEIEDRKIVEQFDDYDRSFGLFSIKDSVDNFGPGYYKDDTQDKILKLLIKQFEDKYGKKFDKYNVNDLSEMSVLFLKDIHKILEDIDAAMKLSDSGQTNKDLKIHELRSKFNPKRELFYNLKFHYKVLSIYNLINETIKNPIDREQAYKCCGNGKGQCFNFFKDHNDEHAIVFGTNKYGYIKDTKCHPVSALPIQEKQKKLLSEVLNEVDVWRNLDKNIKQNYLIYLEDMVNYIGNAEPSLSDQTSSKTVNYFLKKLEKIDNLKIENMFLSKLRSNLLPISYNVNKFITAETKNVISLIEESEDFNKIIRLINDTEAGKKLNKNFDFLKLEDLTLIKFAVVKLLEINSLFIHLKANSSLTPTFLKIVLNLTSTDLNYYNLLKKVGILPRNHGFFLEKLSEILKDNKYINLKIFPLMLSNTPKDSIQFKTEEIQKINPKLKNIFPTKSEDVCEVFKPILFVLRSQKKISPKEYLKYKNLISKECFNRYQIYDPNEKNIQPFKQVDDDYNKMVNIINDYIRKPTGSNNPNNSTAMQFFTKF